MRAKMAESETAWRLLHLTSNVDARANQCFQSSTFQRTASILHQMTSFLVSSNNATVRTHTDAKIRQCHDYFTLSLTYGYKSSHKWTCQDRGCLRSVDQQTGFNCQQQGNNSVHAGMD